jgi:hypothetical protein
MSVAAITQRRRFERVLTISSAFAVLTSLMVVFAPTALAHHPEISASQTCVDKQVRIAYESVSWKTDGTPGSGNSDIRIEVQVDGAGPWIEVASGVYESGNDFRFEGTFDATPYWGESIVVQARAIGPWDNGIGGGETTKTGPIAVSEDCFNPSCPSGYLEYKVEPVKAGVHGGYFTISNVTSGGTGPTFDWSSTVPVYQVIVKGGPGANIYNYEGATSDSGLHASENPNNGKWYGLSHVTFCYEEAGPDPDPVDVTPNPQVCEVKNDVAKGAVSFNIDPASGAMVQVYSDAGHSNTVGGPLGDDEKLTLTPGTYYWKATATGDGYELNGPTSGQFTIDPCEAAVAVASGDCVIHSSGTPMGSVSVDIHPTSGATVQVSGPGGPYDFSGSGGSEELTPGTYIWVATTSTGFELTGETEGGFTIDPCEAAVAVAGGQCEVVDGPQGSVTVSIDVDSGAVVTVYDVDLDVAAQFSGVGGSQKLAPGTYTWVATPGDGFEFPEDEVTSGGFTIDPCVGTVIVSHGNCQVGRATAFGSVTTVIEPDSSVTVSILDDSSNLVTSFSGEGGTKSLLAGDYTWTAEAAQGFTIEGASGGFTVAPCPDEVLGEVIVEDDIIEDEVVEDEVEVEVEVEDEVEALVVLPFTGLDTSVLMMMSVVLFGSGLYLIRAATRREEG